LEDYNQEKAQKMVSELFAKMYAKDKVDIAGRSLRQAFSPASR